MKNDKGVNLEQDLSLAETKLEYCLSFYERDEARRIALENKAQFYLSFVVLIIGAILFNVEFIEKVDSVIDAFHEDMALGKPVSIFVVIAIKIFFISAYLGVISILSGLYSALIAIRVSSYNNPKVDALTSVASPDKYLNKKKFITDAAIEYAKSFEWDRVIINRKLKWINILFYSVSILIFSLFFFMVSTIYLIV